MPTLLTDELCAQLPRSLQTVIPEVRDLTHLRVEVQPLDASKLSGQFLKAAATLDINPDEGEINIWVDTARAQPEAIGHELIHLRRNVLEGVPRLFAASRVSASTANTFHAIENDLEHLFVVPEQIASFPSSKDWWIDHYRVAASRPTTSLVELALNWAVLRNILPDALDVAKLHAARLRGHENEDTVKVADYLREDFKRAMPDKRRVIEAFLAMFPEFRQQGVVGRYTLANGALVGQPID